MLSFNKLNKLCSPAKLYVFLSLLCVLLLLIQNITNSHDIYTFGKSNYKIANKPLLFVIKLLYIVLWTCILQYVCKAGYKNLSWVLVLFPIFMGILALYISLEGYENELANSAPGVIQTNPYYPPPPQ